MRTFGLLPSLVAFPMCLFSQAWLSPKGEGTVSVLYQYGFDRYHSFSDGRTKDRGHTSLQGLVLDTDFSLTDRLAVRVALPYISGKYVGANPHLLIRGRPETIVKIDDGTYHGTLQDFRFDVRYNVSRSALRLTPFFQVLVPSHSYPTLGHSAIGIDLREYRLGVNLGRRLDPILPKAFVQGRYAFGFSEQVAGIAPKRSYAEFQLGYFVSRRWSLQGSGVLMYTHNGIEFDYDLFPNNLTVEQYLNHDRISRNKLLDLGGGVGYSLSPSTSVVFSLGHSVYGANTHLRTRVVTVGIVKGFATKLAGEAPVKRAFLPEASKALVCTCAKSK
jgi:hypothetical protein